MVLSRQAWVKRSGASRFTPFLVYWYLSFSEMAGDTNGGVPSGDSRSTSNTPFR